LARLSARLHRRANGASRNSNLARLDFLATDLGAVRPAAGRLAPPRAHEEFVKPHHLGLEVPGLLHRAEAGLRERDDGIDL